MAGKTAAYKSLQAFQGDLYTSSRVAIKATGKKLYTVPDFLVYVVP